MSVLSGKSPLAVILKGVRALCSLILFVSGIAVSPVGLGALVSPLARAALAEAAWLRQGPGGGEVNALVIDPSASATLYAATLGAGVFKSVDGGHSWAEVNTGLVTTFDDAFVGPMVIDPITPDTLYVGTAMGLFKTTDGGVTWHATPIGEPSSIVISPAIPTVLYAATNGHVFKTTDGGDTWSGLIAAPSTFRLAIDPTSPDTVYAVTGTGLFRTTDGGATWAASGAGLPNEFVAGIAIAPSQSSTIYVATQSGLFKSEDSGATWNSIFYASGGSIAVDPQDADTVYLAGSFVYRTTDGGVHWANVQTVGLPDIFVNAGIDVLTIDPTTPSTLYAGTSRAGVFKSTDGGQTWIASNTGLNAGFVDAVAIDPENPHTVYSGTEILGLFQSTDGGETWNHLTDGLPMFANVPVVTFDPSSPDVIYVAANRPTDPRGMFKSTDHGQTWTVIDNGLTYPDVDAVAIDPLHTSTVYAATPGGGVFKTTDGGGHWVNVGLVNNDESFVNALVLDPTNPSTLYAATYGGVFKTTSGGLSWFPVNNGFGSYVQAFTIALDRSNPNTLFAGVAGRLFKTTDGGQSWIQTNGVGTTAGGGALAIDPSNPTTVYVGSAGLVASMDGGNTWASAGSPLIGFVNTITIGPGDSDSIYIGTSGSGLFFQRSSTTSTTTVSTTTTTTTTLPVPVKSNCSSKELAAAGKKAAAQIACYVKAVTRDRSLRLSTCLRTAEARFGAAYSRAAAPGDCITMIDAATVGANVDAFVNDLTRLLIGSSPAKSRCTSHELAAARKNLKAKINCEVNAVARGESLTLLACLTAAEQNFNRAYTRAGMGADCISTTDAATVEASVDAFVNDLDSTLARRRS